MTIVSMLVDSDADDQDRFRDAERRRGDDAAAAIWSLRCVNGDVQGRHPCSRMLDGLASDGESGSTSEAMSPSPLRHSFAARPSARGCRRERCRAPRAGQGTLRGTS